MNKEKKIIDFNKVENMKTILNLVVEFKAYSDNFLICIMEASKNEYQKRLKDKIKIKEERAERLREADMEYYNNGIY